MVNLFHIITEENFCETVARKIKRLQSEFIIAIANI